VLAVAFLVRGDTNGVWVGLSDVMVKTRTPIIITYALTLLTLSSDDDAGKPSRKDVGYI
jgi:hypothetical protein